MQQPSVTVPERALTDEMLEAEHGSTAYIRTQYKTSMGFFLASKNEVMTARHNVLNPAGQVAANVQVGISLPDSISIRNVDSTAVAQDVTNDLVLLQLESDSPEPAVGAGTATSPGLSGIPGKSQIPDSLSPAPSTHSRRGHSHHRRRGRHEAFSVHVVYDGP